MTKPAYMIVAIDVHDAEGMGRYAEGTMPLLQGHDAAVLAATNKLRIEDGAWPRQRIAVLEFPSLQAAREFWAADDYAAMKNLRESVSDADILLVEGMFETRVGNDAGGHYLLGASTSLDEDWVAEYMQTVPPISAKFGVQPIASGTDYEMLDGQWRGASMVLLRFPSRQVFKDFWYGAEYAPMKALREEHTRGDHVSFAGEFVEPSA